MLLADLHLHTNYSDGVYSPEKVLSLVKENDLSCVSITDHDTLEAYPEAIPAANALGIELIPGIEISASYQAREVHIVGLFVELNNAFLADLLAELKIKRHERIVQMIERLCALGCSITMDEVLKIAGKGSLGRPHVAQALLNHGYVYSSKDAFERYIGTEGAAYVPGSPLDPPKAIDAIKKSGGIPILAHPIYLKDDSLIEKWAGDGLAGLEVYHSSHNQQLTEKYEKIAKRLGLLASGGTDYHGPSKEGGPIGSVKISYEHVEALKKWKQEQTRSL
jgi:3',5'-nucleoside bisphosphate phosphatase